MYLSDVRPLASLSLKQKLFSEAPLDPPANT